MTVKKCRRCKEIIQPGKKYTKMYRHNRFWKWYIKKDFPYGYPDEVNDKDTFCANCKKVIQSKRGWMEKWIG